MKFQLQTLTDYSDEALLAELRRVADVAVHGRLTIELFDSLARVHSTTLRNRFGSWQAALDRACVSGAVAPKLKKLSRRAVVEAAQKYAEENSKSLVTRDELAKYLGVGASGLTGKFGAWSAILAEAELDQHSLGKRYSEEECFENILSLWTHYGRQPSFSELNKPPSCVGSKAYVLRWGGWRSALAAFVSYANADSSREEVSIASAISDPKGSNRAPSAEPRSVNLSLRYKVLQRDRFRCVLCGATPAKDLTVELHIDHINPWSRGGQSIEANLRTLCFSCNLGKGARIEAQQSV